MAENISVGRGPSGIRFVVLDADLSEVDLGQLEAAIQSALKPLDPAGERRAVSVVVCGSSDEPSRVEVAIEPENRSSDAALDTVERLPAARRDTGVLQRITVNPDRCGGRPCLRDLRIRVRDVLDLLAAGADRAEILSDYPMLEDADITAALEYAARQNDHMVLRVA